MITCKENELQSNEVDAKLKKAARPENQREQGAQANIIQNTTHQGNPRKGFISRNKKNS